MASVSGSVEYEKLVQVDEAKIRCHVDEVVRSSVESTLSELLDTGRTSCGRRSSTSAWRIASIRGLAAMTAGCRRRLAK